MLFPQKQRTSSRQCPPIGIPHDPLDFWVIYVKDLNIQKAAWTGRIGRYYSCNRCGWRLLAAADKAGVLGFVSADVYGAETDTGVAVEVGEDAHSIYYEVITCVHCGGAGEKAEIVVCSIYKKRGGLFVTLYG